MIEVKEDDLPLKGDHEFGEYEEKAIISLAFDQPEFFAAIIIHLKEDHFEQYETQFVFKIINFFYESHKTIITRGMCINEAESILQVEDPYQEIIDLIKRESNPRDVPIITDKLVEWARIKQFGLLYSKDAIEAHENGNYQLQEQIIEDARKITNFGTELFWMFDDYAELFVEETEEKLTCGFTHLDKCLNDGGPTRQETLCYMAPTGVGKSIALVNAGVANIRRGKNVLHISLEMTKKQTAHRYSGCFTEIPLRQTIKHQDIVGKRLCAVKSTYNAELIIAAYPPDEISVNTIHGLLDVIKRVHGIIIDVIIIDYLELMIPREKVDGEYGRQKKVSTEISRLGAIENAFVITASQTNRAGNDASSSDKPLDLNKTAESFGKNMPLSYVITINQTKQEYEDGRNGKGDSAPVVDARCRLYIAKNRNGPKFRTIESSINYETMVMKQHDFITPRKESTDACD